MKYPRCVQCRDEVEWYVLWGNSGLVILKGGLGVMSGSAALIADTLHSFADVLATIMTLISLKISARAPDERHSYGYGKIQHVASGIIGLLLVTGSVFIVTGAFIDILNGSYEAPKKIALLGALFAIVANELMFRYETCVATENNSPAIMANAWDNRSDAISSAGVLVGLLFATLGFPIADPIGALVIGLMVAKIGLSLILESIDSLMDAAPDIVRSEGLYNLIRTFPKVRGINYLRARSLGEHLYVEVDIRVDPHLKVFEGDLILAALQNKIKQEIEHVGEIQLYLTPQIRQPEEDEED
jgi:cation diffusion facilitator family transporter